jgi:hypothetical protein
MTNKLKPLKDFRKALNRPDYPNKGLARKDLKNGAVKIHQGRNPLKKEDFRLVDERTVDRWISKYGANTPLLEVLLAIGWIRVELFENALGKEYKFSSQKAQKELEKKLEEAIRKKLTDEVGNVSESPQEDSELHGGNGNSQEVDHESESQSPESRDEDKGKGDSDKLQNELEKALDSLKEEDSEGNKEESGYCSKQADHFLERALKKLKSGDRRFHRVIRYMEKFFMSAMISGDEESPRLNAARLVREISSKRYALNRCRKNEQGKLPILIMVDVSGSCSASAGGNLEAAIAIQRKLPEAITVVIHSNGYPERVYGKGLIIPDNHRIWYNPNFDSISFYTSQKWSMVINLGDSHAHKEMIGMQENGAKIFLVDSYGAKGGKVFEMKDDYPHVGGVNDTTDLWVALKIYKKTWS